MKITLMALKDGYISEDDIEGSHLRVGDWSHIYQRM